MYFLTLLCIFIVLGIIAAAISYDAVSAITGRTGRIDIDPVFFAMLVFIWGFIGFYAPDGDKTSMTWLYIFIIAIAAIIVITAKRIQSHIAMILVLLEFRLGFSLIAASKDMPFIVFKEIADRIQRSMLYDDTMPKDIVPAVLATYVVAIVIVFRLIMLLIKRKKSL